TIWDPQFGFLRSRSPLQHPRTFATATALADGRVVVAGGTDFVQGVLLETLAVFQPMGATGKMLAVPDVRLPVPTSHHAAGLAPDGTVWLTGGLPTDLARPGLRQVTVLRPRAGP
ncbi:MAG: hypothetical protein ACE5JG_06195, partial [Planctomycetota bacterium]